MTQQVIVVIAVQVFIRFRVVHFCKNGNSPGVQHSGHTLARGCQNRRMPAAEPDLPDTCI